MKAAMDAKKKLVKDEIKKVEDSKKSSPPKVA
jgi:hypothetical protein